MKEKWEYKREEFTIPAAKKYILPTHRNWYFNIIDFPTNSIEATKFGVQI